MNETEKKFPVTFEDALRTATSDAIKEALENKNMTLCVDGQERKYFAEGFENKLKRRILTNTAALIEEHNMSEDIQLTGLWTAPQKLHFSQIAQIITELYDVTFLVPTDDDIKDKRENGIDYPEGTAATIWYGNIEMFCPGEDTFRAIAMRYDYTMTNEEFNSCMSILKSTLYNKENSLTIWGSLLYDKSKYDIGENIQKLPSDEK